MSAVTFALMNPQTHIICTQNTTHIQVIWLLWFVTRVCGPAIQKQTDKTKQNQLCILPLLQWHVNFSFDQKENFSQANNFLNKFMSYYNLSPYYLLIYLLILVTFQIYNKCSYITGWNRGKSLQKLLLPDLIRIMTQIMTWITRAAVSQQVAVINTIMKIITWPGQ